MAQVTITDLSKTYPGDIQAVKNISLTIADREFVVLVGPSGCGKSTTLRMIAGLEDITAGTIVIGDRVINDVPPKDRDIAMVFQNYALYPHMSVYDNMAFGLKLRKMPKADIDRRVQEAAEILGITALLKRKPKALSGGQRQRVAVGRAIVRKPAVFLFDEPLSNLDAKMRVQMRVEISRLHTRLGATMVYVTHDQTEAMTMGDRIVVMKDGIIHQSADPLTLYDKPADKFVAGFIGMPPMNFFEGVIETRGSSLAFTCDGGAIVIAIPARMTGGLARYAGKPITLGIRPEDIGSNSAVQTEGAPALRATVEVLEPMGAETFVYFKTGTHSFVSRVEPHIGWRVGETVNVPLYVPRLHFFDGVTEKAIAP